MDAQLTILVDSREQAPYGFSKYDAVTESATLPCADYSLPGWEDRVAVERKSLNDLIACLMGKDRERFERELSHHRFYDRAAVVIEASMDDVSKGRYRSEMKSHAALQSIITFQGRFRIPFVWAGSCEGGE